ncbi:MAG: hypothetical protein HY927_02225 [Elusimicrobia bacterium]|nr:hypothetical protein [Elusimicrobiota bacterium]
MTRPLFPSARTGGLRSALMLAIALSAVPWASLAARAQDDGLIGRKVLAVYRKEDIKGAFKDIAFLQIHTRAEMPLNHLGVEVVYREASEGLPDPAGLRGYAGVLAWFERRPDSPAPGPVCRWLRSALLAGTRVVVLGDLGTYAPLEVRDPAVDQACVEMLKTLGAEVAARQSVDVLGAAVASVDKRLMGFERAVSLDGLSYVPRVRLLPGGRALLRLALSEGALKQSEPVGVTSRGALALDPFFLYENKEIFPFQYRWVVDPFAFFEEAFRLKGLPRPDVTTINGRRVYINHVDGDGFFNRSELDPKKWSGEVFLGEIVDKYPDTPFSVSMITGYADLAGFNDASSWKLARDLLTRPNVEPASHGYAHPLVWNSGKLALNIPGYRMDAGREVAWSVAYLNERVLPKERPTRLFFWTGDCLPSAQDVAVAEKAGLLHVNGEGGRFDGRYPSYSYLYPLSRQVGAARQVYAPASNEDSYTNHWTGPFFGFREVVETFEKTGLPRRVKPVDVYVHLYGAEKYAALQAIHKVFEWARAKPLHPVWISRYIRSVQGFFTMRVRRLGEGRFRLEGGAPMRTIRFDAEKRSPDLASSKGVIGFKREGESLYVFLDEGEAREVVLSAQAPRLPYLAEANFEVSRWVRDGGGVRFFRQGWWKGECVLAGLAPARAYRVRSGPADLRLVSDAAGTLRVGFPDAEGQDPAREVRVEPQP